MNYTAKLQLPLRQTYNICFTRYQNHFLDTKLLTFVTPHNTLCLSKIANLQNTSANCNKKRQVHIARMHTCFLCLLISYYLLLQTYSKRSASAAFDACLNPVFADVNLYLSVKATPRVSYLFMRC